MPPEFSPFNIFTDPNQGQTFPLDMSLTPNNPLLGTGVSPMVSANIAPATPPTFPTVGSTDGATVGAGGTSGVSFTPSTLNLDLGATNDPNSEFFLGSNVDEKGNRETVNSALLRNPNAGYLLSQMPGDLAFPGTNPYYAQMLGRSIGFDLDQFDDLNPNDTLTSGQQKGLKTANVFRGIFGGLGLAMSTAKNVLSGIGQERRQQFNYMRNQEKLREGLVDTDVGGSEDLFRNLYLQRFGIGFGKYGGEVEMYKHGGEVGEIPYEHLISGRLTTGFAPEQEAIANAELERDEYVQYPDGNISKVEGDKHGRGGEKMLLPEGTRILSDSIKVGKDDAKLFQELGVKAKAGDTYARVMDKFEKSSGITALHEEQEKRIKQLEENSDVKDNNTRGVNEQFLSEEINQLEAQKTEYRALENFMFDVLYTKQETKKEKEGTGEESSKKEKKPAPRPNPMNIHDNHVTYIPQDGSSTTIEIPTFFEDGGVYTSKKHVDNFKKWAHSHGFKTMKEATQAILEYKKGGKKEKMGYYEDGGEVNYSQKLLDDGRIEIIAKEGDDPVIMSASEYVRTYDRESYDNLLTVGSTLNENPLNDPTRRIAGQDQRDIDGNVVFGDVDSREEIVKRLEILDKQFPHLVRTAFGVTYDADGNIENFSITPEKTKKFQQGVKKTLEENIELGKAIGLPESELQAMEEFVRDENFVDGSFTGDKTARLIDTDFGNFTSTRANISSQLITPEDQEVLNNLGITSLRQLKDALDSGYLNREELSQVSRDMLDKIPEDFNLEGEGFLLDTLDPTFEVPEITPEPVEETELPAYRETTGASPTRGIPMINQDPLPPPPLASHRFAVPEFDELSPIKLSPEQALVEGNRFSRMAFEAISRQPGAQQGANISNTIAQLGDQANKAVVETNRENARIALDVDRINQQTGINEELQKQRALDSFDALQLKALDNYQQDVQNYFNRLTQNRVQARKEDLALKVLDSASDNFSVDPLAGLVFTGGSLPPLFNNPLVLEAYQKAEQQTNGSA